MQRLLILVGPTGVGKTATAIELCERLDGEIISADSMQIYRGLDIGSAKPSAAEQARARHHLIDIREPDETYSAAQWADDARVAINDMVARGKQPIIAGGTGFYIRALLQPETLASAPPDTELRTTLEREAAEHGVKWLHRKLQGVDAAAAARLHPNDVRRVIRAIEVASAPQSETEVLPNTEISAVLFDVAIHGLKMAREKLYPHLDARVDTMLATGFMDELRVLKEGGASPDSTAMQGVGYKQMWPVLENAELFDEGVELWKRDTRRYAKRQMTWFRHQLPVNWIEVDETSAPGETAEFIAHRWQRRSSVAEAQTGEAESSALAE